MRTKHSLAAAALAAAMIFGVAGSAFAIERQSSDAESAGALRPFAADTDLGASGLDEEAPSGTGDAETTAPDPTTPDSTIPDPDTPDQPSEEDTSDTEVPVVPEPSEDAEPTAEPQQEEPFGYGAVPIAPGLSLNAGQVNGRLAGADRYDTAAAISRSAYASTVDTVVIATGVNFPDSLSAAPLAAKRGAPLLLTLPDRIPAATLAELQRLKPNKILVVGSASAVGQSVFDALVPLAKTEVRRLAGVDRFETSAVLAREGWGAAGAANAFIATGYDYADALSAGPAAAKNDSPVLLVPTSGPAPASTLKVLDDLKVQGLFVAGSTVAVSDEMVNSLRAGKRTLKDRYAGADRFETSAQIANKQFTGAVNASYWATGTGFADALAGAAVAGAQAAPLLLVQSHCVPTTIYNANDRLRPTQTFLLGSASVLNDGVQHGNECAAAPAAGQSASDVAGSRQVYEKVNAERFARKLPAARLADAGKSAGAVNWSVSMSAAPASAPQTNPNLQAQQPWVKREYVQRNPTASNADPGVSFEHLKQSANGSALITYQPADQRVLVSAAWLHKGQVSWLTVHAGV